MKDTELWVFGDGFNPNWVAFGEHLPLNELISRHSVEYENHTKKQITGCSFQYAKKELDEDYGEDVYHYYLHENDDEEGNIPVTLIHGEKI